MRRIALILAVLAVPGLAHAQQPAQFDGVFARWSADGSPGCALGVDLDGRPVLRRAWGLAELEHDVPATVDTIYEAGSVSKQFTAAAILLLADDGLLSLDDDVRVHLPELPDYGPAITVRQLLNHTSGLRDWGSVAAIEGWPRGSRVVDNDTVLDILARQRSLNFAPGSEWSYSNSGYNLAAVLVERVSGVSLADFSTRRLFQPLGMSHTRWRDDFAAVVPGRATAYARMGGRWRQAMPFENAYGNGGLLTTVGDLLIWNAALAEDRLGLTGRLETRGRVGDRSTHYGLGLQHAEVLGQAEIAHSGFTGGYRGWSARYPDSELSVALLCNAGDASPEELGRAVAALYLPDPADTSPVTATIPAPTGLFASGRTGEPLGLIAGADGRAVTQQGQPLRPLGPGLFGLGGDRLEVVSADAFLRLTQDGDRIRYDRVEPVTPTPDTLAAYTGVYISDEAPARLTLEIRNGRLVIVRSEPDPLAPTYADVFVGPPGVVRFERDGSGRVVALHINNGRVRDMMFRRAD